VISAPLIEYLKKGIFTLLGAMLAVYLFVILLTYTGNDPSWSHISSDMTTINNTGGAMGAWLSDLLYSFFGSGAWWLIAFLVYETIWLWWGNKSTYWVIRVAAYIFLLLSGSALITQLMALFQLSPDWAMVRPSGALGGIVGLELQLRLAKMLSPWGCALFLTLFMIITATFAFNIHWRAFYQKITNASWFGTGVKDPNQKVEKSPSQPNNKATKALSAPNLNLQPAFEGAGVQSQSNSASFKHALSDFLATSGLVASVKATLAAEEKAPESADVLKADTEANQDEVTTDPITTNTSTSEPVIAPQLSPKSDASESVLAEPASSNFIQRAFAAKGNETKVSAPKVEPSFAWNDSGMVNDLLASQTAPLTSEPPASSFIYSIAEDHKDIQSQSEDNTHDDADQAADDDLITDELMQLAMSHNRQSQPAAQVANKTAFESADDTAKDWQEEASANDDFTDTYFEEAHPAEFSQDSFNQNDFKQNDIKQNDINQNNFKETHLASKDFEPEESAFDTDDDSALAILETAFAPTVLAPAQETEHWGLDMTPTNTPPSNPAAPPKAEDEVKSTEPTIQFAIPEWQANNTISEMVPDEPAFPDIYDDAAFATRSRAMQTASYRAQLTPIPEIDILDKPDPNQEPSYTAEELEQLSELLEIKLQEFNVKAEVVTAIPGPVVTRFEVELAAGVKASKVTNISRDLARSLSMASLRVVEVIPGKPYIGIEVPNKQREMVRLIELLGTKAYQDSNSHISMAMGKDISGKPIITDLSRAPHMLVAGTTGSGKSVLVNAMLLSMLLKYTPDELRLILIDPKQLELANYNDIPHLLTPVVTDMTEAASSLSWCVAEMERRYQLMSLLKVRKLHEFNKKVRAAEKAGQPLIDPLWRPNDSVSMDKAPKLKTLPLIVIVADEFADMIMQVGKQAEELITRLAQKSRAAGIHLMLATQRPSVDVITGLIKANIPVRAALRVNSKVDSRTILDSGGAEDMLGNGDMLFLGPGQIEPDRVHGAYVSDEEVNRVCDAWRDRGAPDYIDNMAGNFELTAPSGTSSSASGEDDDLYNDAVAFVMETRKVSASSIQRKFSIGYNRAARIVDSMEDAGLVSSMGKSGKRELLM